MALAQSGHTRRSRACGSALVARLLRDLMRQIVDQSHLWVGDLAATNADEMRMRIGPAAIVAIIIVSEAKLQYLIQFLEKMQRLVDRGRARGGELRLDLLIQVGRAGVSLAGGNQPQKRTR